MYYDLEKYPEAIETFRKEIALRPTAVSYHFLGNSYGYVRKFEEAPAAYKQTLWLNPKNTDVYGKLGDACHRLGRLDEAVRAYTNSINAQPYNSNARLAIGLTELMCANPYAALE